MTKEKDEGVEELIPTIDFDFTEEEAPEGIEFENTKGEDAEPQKDETDDPPKDDDSPKASEEEEKEEEESEEDYTEQQLAAATSAYEIYKDQGLVPELSEAEQKDLKVTPEFVHDQMVKQARDEAQGFLDSRVDALPEWGQKLLRLANAKGKDVTMEEAQELFQLVQPSTYAETDFTDIEKSKAYLKDYHEKAGYPEETIQEIIDSLETKGKVNEQALAFWKTQESNRSDKADEIVTEAENWQKGNLESKEKFDNSFTTALKDTGWKATKQRAVLKEFYSGAFKTKFQKILQEHPEALISLVDYISHLKDGKIDHEAYQKQALTPSVTKVKDNMGKYFKSGQLDKSAQEEPISEDAQQFTFAD